MVHKLTNEQALELYARAKKAITTIVNAFAEFLDAIVATVKQVIAFMNDLRERVEHANGWRLWDTQGNYIVPRESAIPSAIIRPKSYATRPRYRRTL